MARRRIVLDNFLGGLHTHDFKPGTLRLAQDVLPYKGMLRKRGPKTLEARTGMSVLSSGMGYSESVNEEYGIAVRNSSNARAIELDSASSPVTISTHSANSPNFFHSDPFCAQSHPWIRIGNELVLSSSADRHPGADTHVPNSRGQHFRWAGNTSISASHSTGNVNTTAGSRVINGGSVSPAFTSSHVGGYIELGNTDLGCYRIVKYISATQVLVDVPVATSLTNASYEINAVGRACVNNPTTAGTRLFSNFVDTGGTLRPAYSPQVKNFLYARMLAPHQQRLFAFGLSEPTPLDASSNYSQAMDSVVRWSGTQKDAQTNGVPWWCNFNVNAYAEILGNGTAIGAASFQGSLVCLKDQSISLLSGPVASDGTDLGVSQSLISDYVGAARPGSWGVGRTGVFFCNHEGLFEWNGQELRNHVEGRIGSFWDNWLNSANGSVPVLSVVGDRVYVVPRSGTYAFDVALVWSIPYQAWFFQQTGSADGFSGPVQRVMRGGAPWRDVMIHDDGLVDHSGDYDFGSSGSELGGLSGPTVSVATQPIQISPDGVSGGRPTNVFLKYRLEDAGSDNPELDPSLYLSPLGVDDSDSSYGIVYGDGLTETDHGLETRRMQVGGASTIPLDGASGADSGFVSVRLDQQNDAKDVVLAAVGVEFEDEGRWPQN